MSLKMIEQVRRDWIAQLTSQEHVESNQAENHLEALHTLTAQYFAKTNPSERIALSSASLSKRLARLAFAMVVTKQTTVVDLNWALNWKRRWRWGKKTLNDAIKLGILHNQNGYIEFSHPALQCYFASLHLKQWFYLRFYLRSVQIGAPGHLIDVLCFFGQMKDAARPVIPALLPVINHPNREIRTVAAETVLQIAHPIGVKAVSCGLRESGSFFEYTNRPADLMRLIGQLEKETEPFLEALVAELGPSHPILQQPAANALTTLGPIAVPALVQALNVGDSVQVKNSIYVLSQIGIPVVEYLITTRYQPIDPVKEHLEAVLKQMRPLAVDYLIQQLNSENSASRRATINTLSYVADRDAIEHLISMTQDKSLGVAGSAIETLVRYGAKAVDTLSKVLVDRTQNINLRETVAIILERIGVAAVPALIAAASHADPNIRLRAVESLGELHQPESLECLAQAAFDSVPMVRLGAVNALMNLIDTKSVNKSQLGAIFISALDDPDTNVRGLAVMCIGKLKASEYIEALLEMVSDEAPYVRQNIAYALGYLTDKRSVQALWSLLDDSHWHVRYNALVALGYHNADLFLPRVCAMLDDTSPEVRNAAQDLLESWQRQPASRT